jgi:tRNA (cmo5U34)-methyltransferase
MSIFDNHARTWDDNPIHWERSEAIEKNIIDLVPVKHSMRALEYGAGTGILSFLLADKFSEITLMDNSSEMVQVMHEKVQKSGLLQLKPVFFDLEHSTYKGSKFDFVYSQMVLHHVSNTAQLIKKFSEMLNPGGYLAIADLFSEDGSFHGVGFEGHKGFDLAVMKAEIEEYEFTHLASRNCYTIKKIITDKEKEFPVFIMIASKSGL